MAADFNILEEDADRFGFASQLLTEGRSIGFGDFELRLQGSELLVSVLTEKPEVTRAEADSMKAGVSATLGRLFSLVPQMKPFQALPRHFELVVFWGKGSTWLGYWQGEDYFPGRRDGDRSAR